MKAIQFRKSIRIIVLAAFLLAACFQFMVPAQNARADVVAGFAEYYIPGPTAQINPILQNLTTSYTGLNIHNVITFPVTTAGLTIYYDHWENGLLSGPNGDEVYTIATVGQVVTFESPTIAYNHSGMDDCAGSTNPGATGTSTRCYDGGDRIFIVGGAVSMSQVFWPQGTGTVYANAWEIYPSNAWVNSYTLPVGEDLFDSYPNGSYADYHQVYVMVMASQDSTAVTIDDPRYAGVEVSTTLNRGGATQLYHVGKGTQISADKPVQVQWLNGYKNSNFDSRGHTLVPSNLWDKDYYSPVPSFGTSANNSSSNGTGSNLTLTKSTQTGFSYVGEVLQYSYSLTNNGYTKRLGPVTMTDDKTTVTCPALNTIGNNDGYLDRNETLVCTGSYTITQADLTAGSVTNKASATLVGAGVSTSQASLTVYAPTTISTPVNIYMYNPGATPLTVTYKDTAGTANCSIPAGGTMSLRDAACAGRFVAINSAVQMSASAPFFAVGEYDSGSSARNWGFSIIPSSSLRDEYYVAWAPGADQNPITVNGNPVFVSPTVDGQVIYADFSPTDGIPDVTLTLNQLQMRKILDTDNNNTGMHLWSDQPFSIVWGEDAQYSGTGNPYIDAGYTILPLIPGEVTLSLQKAANPNVITKIAGEEVEFTLTATTGIEAVSDVYLTDLLPPYFQYKTGTTKVTLPGGSETSYSDPSVTGSANPGYTLRWPATTGKITDMNANETLVLKFTAVTVAGIETILGNTFINNADVYGKWGTLDLNAKAQASITVGQPGHLIVEKDVRPDALNPFHFNLWETSNPSKKTSFQLVDHPNKPGENSENFTLKPSTYAVAEDLSQTPGFDQISATCVTNVVGKPNPTPASIPLAAGETVTCTFVNMDHPTAVDITNPEVSVSFGVVTLTWDTIGEPATLVGFNVYRSENPSDRGALINSQMISPKNIGGNSDYLFVDGEVLSGHTYYYWVEATFSDGAPVLLAGNQPATIQWYLRLPVIRR